MVRRGRLALAAVVWTAAASLAHAQTPTQADVDRAEAAWRAVAPGDYTITLVVHAFERGAGTPFTFHVADGDARLMAPQPDEAVRQFYSRYGTVDLLFSLVRDALTTKADRLTATFHPTLGYPTSISIDQRLNRMHDETSLEVLDLRADPPLPGQAADGTMPSVVTSRAVVAVPVRVGPRRAPASEFEPAIPAIDVDGRCEQATTGAPGQRWMTYAFGPRERPSRRIHVRVDNGGILSYVDNRGDTRAPSDETISAADPPGPRTVIMIDWARQRADLANLVDGHAVLEIQSWGPDVLTAPNLGVPADVVAMVVAQCGPPR